MRDWELIAEDRERARRDALSPNYYGDGEKGAPDKLTTFADALQCHKALSYDHHMLYYRFEKLVKRIEELERLVKDDKQREE